MNSDARDGTPSRVDIVSSEESSSELFDISDKIASTAVFSSDARVFFRFFSLRSFKEFSEDVIESSVEASEEDRETVRGIVSDCAEVTAAVRGTLETVVCWRWFIIG